MEILLTDIQQALRTLRKNPSFTLVALAAVTIGIGANTAIFSVVNKVLLQPLPYPDPDRLVQLGRSYPGGVGYATSIPKYMVWRSNDAFSCMALYDRKGLGLNLSSGDHPQQIKGAHISADYFKVFGVSPIMGRTFTAAEDLPGGPRAAMISEALWRSDFGSDPGILNRTITLSSEQYPVIGVISARFIASPEAEIWIPLQAAPNSGNQAHYLAVAARLKPGVTLGQAQAQMRAVGERFRRLHPKIMDKNESAAVTPMLDAQVTGMKSTLYILLSAVAFVLLIACANVANLLLARSAVRQRELSIRAAIGATPWRVVRQLLTESILLSAAGGVLGLLLGVIGVRALLLLAPGDIPRLSNPDQLQGLFALVDWRILVFTAGISLLTGVLFGLIPALQISNPNLASTLKEAGTRSATSRHQNLTRKTLVAMEMALALVLLTSAALLIRTFVGLSTAESGVDSQHVLTMLTSLSGQRYQTTEALDLFARQVLQRIEAIPGVEMAASSISPPTKGSIDLPFNIAGKAPAAGEDYNGEEQWRSVSAHYFSLLRVPLQRGRMFTERDTTKSAKVAIVNAAFASKFFLNGNAVGKIIDIARGIGPEFADSPREIVGVVGDVRESGVAQGKVPVMYIPQSQQQEGLSKLASSVAPLAWEVRSSLDERTLSAAISKEVQAVDGQMPVAGIKTLDKILQDSLARQNFNMLLLSIFAGSALLLAAIGIYGLMSYAVEQQTQELGVRMALGADKPAMVRLVLRQGMKPALIGVAAGLAVAFGVTRLLQSLLYGVKPTDPLSFLGVAGMLILVAILAILIPARRAMSVDPVVALRTE